MIKQSSVKDNTTRNPVTKPTIWIHDFYSFLPFFWWLALPLLKLVCWNSFRECTCSNMSGIWYKKTFNKDTKFPRNKTNLSLNKLYSSIIIFVCCKSWCFSKPLATTFYWNFIHLNNLFFFMVTLTLV
jgi:hypothetical protein